MGVFEIILSVIAACALLLALYVCIRYKNVPATLALGLLAIALVFGIVISSNNNDRSKRGKKPQNTSVVKVENTATDAMVNASVMPNNTPENTDQNTSVDATNGSGSQTNQPTSTMKPSSSTAPVYTPSDKPSASVPPVTTPNGTQNGSTIYLTFDDGPSYITNDVLDALAKYNVKATFFIVNFDDSQIPVLKRMVNEGHTIGIHGYSHEYSAIYKSTDAFMENVTKLRNKIRDKIGYDATIMRFPGGSSNSTSKQYCTGVMTALVKIVEEQGYTYVDWNVDPSDALSKLSEEEVYSGVVSRLVPSRKANVVLMHDFSGQAGTAAAVDDIIEYGLANGYKFDRLSSDSPECHHSVNN